MNNTKTRKETTSNKDKKLKQILLVGVGLTATGVAGYFGYQYYKKQKENGGKKQTTFAPPADPIPEYQPSNNAPPSYDPPPVYNNSGGSKPKSNGNTNNTTYNPIQEIVDNASNVYNAIPKSKSEFPLKKGSKGDKVRQLQQALIAQHGASIMPKYGADGQFGSEMANALKKLNYPAKITESLFNVITSSKGANTNSLAKQLVTALSKHDFPKTVSLLQQIGSVSEYTTVSNEFKTMRVNGGVRQTLVNGALNAFLDSKQKQTIRMEFLRMGLKFDGSKWTLSGFDGFDEKQIITIRPTQIWIDGVNSKSVPSNMILGRPIAQRLDYTLFENNGQHFLVKSKDIIKH
jgi:hypothetical protein